MTKKTALEELVERFNTRDQARFYLEHMGASFADYQAAHDTYQRALVQLKGLIPPGTRSQFVAREFLPNFTFGEQDLALTVGPDGLVVNTAKYLTAQPLLAVNPDPKRIDGVLVPFTLSKTAASLAAILDGRFQCRRISMAKATLNDGQSLYAVNDLFLGQRTHVSARYRLRLADECEDQSSSGIIVSTGAGSTGWFRSIVTGAAKVMETFAEETRLSLAEAPYRFDWEAAHLHYSVREPFVSKVSSAQMVFGRIEAEETLEVTSQMPQNGVIFSDGIEEDYLEFNSGAIARIGLAEKRVHLITAA